MFFWQSLSGKILSLLSAWFSTHHMKARDCRLFYEQPHQFLHLITWLEKWKAAGFKSVPHLHRDGRSIYPFYRQVLPPVIPINTRHLSRPRRGTRAVPQQFHSWVNHPTSHLYFQTHTHTHPMTHVPQKPPVPPGALNGLISLLIWDLCLTLLTALTHFKAFPWISAAIKKEAVS